ncbi:hypothetical protein [Nocardia sp. IFM 10818]
MADARPRGPQRRSRLAHRRPRGTDEVKNDKDAAADATAPADKATEGETETKTRFRMAPVFDISQTEGIEDFEGEPLTVEPVADPAAALAASLVEQLERYGYQVTTGDPADIDHEARTVTTSPGEQAEQLAQALAVVLTLPPDARPRQQPTPRTAAPARQTPPPPADPSRIRLGLGKYADAHATIRTDYTTGRTFYTVTGPRVSGTFTIVSQNPTENDTVQRFSVEYGEENRPHSFGGYHRQDRPVINGIDLVGGSSGFTVDRIDDIDGTRLHCRRALGPSRDEDAPPRTKERAAAIVRAILRHYMTRDDLHALHRAAAAVEAPYLRAEQNRAAANLADRIARLEAEHAEHTAQAQRYDAIATDTEQLTLI